ncbi:hypothetical protein QE364_000964 [Nocardioides zeae]|uniref:Uncharacterized protein n=1 Tax=Nocardioides zeae TaxID=1457234 RepID=A0ACC6IFI7_9ACTN|nr:hypothetical protein [Nocardioides zeae]MDR6174918.1 hypothetical protein [Nocardioides zeae]MDR6209272.1 hypothetical protein [Nocardioides zeae]
MSHHWNEDPFREPFGDHPFGDVHPGERVTHLVLLDGRLVDAWTTDVAGTRWEPVARALERERRPPAAPVVSTVAPPPPHEQVLAWLDTVVGGRASLLALDGRPTVVDPEPPPGLTPGVAERRVVVRDLVGAVAEEVFDDDVAATLLQVVDLVAVEEPDLLTGALSALQVAGGVCWLVGRANGLFTGGVTQTTVRDLLGLASPLTGGGQAVRSALGVAWPEATPPPSWTGGRLIATGRPEVLTRRVRRQLVRSRDRALAELERVRREQAPHDPTADAA